MGVAVGVEKRHRPLIGVAAQRRLGGGVGAAASARGVSAYK